MTTLANASREYQRVYVAVQLQVVRPNVVENPVREQVKSKTISIFVWGRSIQISLWDNFPKIGCPSKRFPAWFGVQNVFFLKSGVYQKDTIFIQSWTYFGDMKLFQQFLVVARATSFICKVKNQAWVNGTRTRSPREAVHGCQTHRGVERFPFPDCTCRSAGSKM